MKFLFLDIETLPNIVASWGIHDVRINYTDILPDQEWSILSVQWTWDKSKKINSFSVLDDEKRFKKSVRDDYSVVKKIHELISEADVIVGHNIKNFDLKKIQAKIIEHRLPPLKIPLVIDTYAWSRSFGFTSRKLRDLCKKLKLSEKLTHEPGAFLKAALGDKDAIKNIVTYGIGDVPTLRELYFVLRPYAPNHPNQNLFRGKDIEGCSRCGHNEYIASGFKMTTVGKFQRYQCKGCGHWFQGKKAIKRVNLR